MKDKSVQEIFSLKEMFVNCVVKSCVNKKDITHPLLKYICLTASVWDNRPDSDDIAAKWTILMLLM